MYDGWMTYGGQEIFNGPRTKAYLQHLQPSLSLGTECCDCDTLAEALGDQEYASPSQDPAAWYTPYAPGADGFYGLIPLSVEGFENSTWDVPLTELMGHGSVSGRGRRGGRDLRFRMLAVADSEKAMTHGLSWLTDALGAEGCASGDCGGAQICYLTDCPPCCADDAPEAAAVIDHLDYRGMTGAAAAAAAAVDWQSTVTPTSVVSAGQTYARWAGSGLSVQRALTGFVPGAAYRIALDFGASAVGTEIRLSVPGAAELLAPRHATHAFGSTPAPAQGVAAWDFIATECDQRILIESTGDLAIGMLDVAMTSLEGLSLSSQPPYYSSEAQSWTSELVLDPTYLVDLTTTAEWSFYAVTGSKSIAAGEGEIHSIVTGLTPGRTYRATVLTATDEVSGAVYTARPGVVAVEDGTGALLALVPAPVAALGDGRHGGWTTVEFTATQPAAILRVANNSPVTVTTAISLKISARSVTVEEVEPFIELPDASADLRRYLRDVVLTSGPRIRKVFPSYTVVMKEIEWTMRANQPDPLGEDIHVTSTLGPSTWFIPEVVCTLGEAVRYNYAPNPSGEYGTNSWPPPAGSTVTNPASATAYSGSKVIRVTHTVANTVKRDIVLATIPALPNTGWTFTVPVRTSRGGRKVSAVLTWQRAVPVSGFAATTITTSDSLTDWQLIVVSGVTPPGTTAVTISVEMPAPAGGFVANEYAEFDGLLLEQEYGSRAFFDGDSRYGEWAGTPGNSTSEYERTSVVLVYDPDCPPPPPPPRPPAIVNDCLTTPETWIRYVLEIPALATSRSPRSAPVMTIQTGAVEARGLRVRVHANPFGRTIEDLDPCAFCGEFQISYMPPNSVLTVDAADKTATIVTSTGEQSALGLLFGSDGGPVTWPSLGCAMPYLVTVDVDAEFSPLIAASLSITPTF